MTARAALGPVAEALRGVVDDGLALHAGFTAVGATASLKELAADLPTRPPRPTSTCSTRAARGRRGRGEQDFDGLIRHAAEHGTG